MLGRRPVETRGPNTLRVDWMPGIGLLGAAVGAGAVLGYTAGAGHPPLYLSLGVCALIGGLAFAAWQRRRAPLPAPARGKLVQHGTPHVPFDLSRDRTTDTQKYVM